MRRLKRVSPKPNLDDEWCDRTDEACAHAMARWLKHTINCDRPIRSLTLAELKIMARNATDTWIIEASQRVEVAPTESEQDYLMSVLA